MKRLHKHTLDALRHKMAVAADEAGAPGVEGEDPEAWRAVYLQCSLAVDYANVPALRTLRLACLELENYLMGDLPAAERTAIVADLCRARFYPIHDPEAVCTHKIKTRLVDGVRYETGE